MAMPKDINKEYIFSRGVKSGFDNASKAPLRLITPPKTPVIPREIWTKLSPKDFVALEAFLKAFSKF
jgi:hypothetical protein